MQIYIGYGFNTHDIPAEDIVALVKQHDASLYADLQDSLRDTWPEQVPTDEQVQQILFDLIDETSDDLASYLCGLINGNESEKAGADSILTTYDEYLVFDSIRFTDDSKRAEYIRNEEDFIALIGRYLPTDHITFGNLYDGVEWADPCYTLD